MVENAEALCLRALRVALDRCSDFLCNVDEGRVVRRNAARGAGEAPPNVSELENGVMGRQCVRYSVAWRGSSNEAGRVGAGARRPHLPLLCGRVRGGGAGVRRGHVPARP
eukprot:TRINITY_DN4188_c0_g1_i1.p2 TRINITY_DN4188_c0_g1~~TRINITY_DN4188_c0_g1_i1.p2  ORF type:complete len:110 (-),score=16.39 TRINITY_DN4188_c0_g1_i1:114-443(-)